MGEAGCRQILWKNKEAAKGGQKQPGYSSDLLLENLLCKNSILIILSLYAKINVIDSKMHFFPFTFFKLCYVSHHTVPVFDVVFHDHLHMIPSAPCSLCPL